MLITGASISHQVVKYIFKQETKRNINNNQGTVATSALFVAVT